MKVFVVTGYNDILNSTGPIGVATTKEGAEKIVKDNEYYLTKHLISEMELQDYEL